MDNQKKEGSNFEVGLFLQVECVLSWYNFTIMKVDKLVF